MAIYADRSSPPFPARCAVYTRTSRAGETDPAFTSINAQQDACYAFIASRHHLTCLPVSVSSEDPGGTLERPALQQMLADLEADRIDMVVVYKLDRLSRGMVHFARLMETFERHHVTLVSVTQHLNSHDAAGRLAINALMTFAQFERENTGERIRDKIRATRRQGMWTGSVQQHPRYEEAAVLAMLVNVDAVWDMLVFDVRRALVQTTVRRVTIGTDKVSISLDLDGVGQVVLDLLKGLSPKSVAAAS